MSTVPVRPRRLAGPAATIVAAGSAFAALTDSVRERDGLAGHDASVTADVVGHRTGTLTQLAHLLTFLGSEAVVGVLALGLVIVLLERRGPRQAAIAIAAMGTSAALTVGVKLAIGRARPGAVDRLGAVDSTYSFPSGHTLNSAVLLGLVCVLLAPVLARRVARAAVCVAALVLAAGVGASRVYLGYHWTTDVLASWTIAAIIVSAAHVASRWPGRPATQSGGVQVDRPTVGS